MSNLKTEVTEFTLTGQLLGFVIKDGYKIKYFRMAIADREYWIKPAKELRNQLEQEITPGCLIEVGGTTKQCWKTGKIKLKAYSVKRVAIPEVVPTPISALQPQATPSKPKKACVLVCQKSDCRKRGGQAVCATLQESLRDRGLESQVEIKLTGCLKACKDGPNIIMMPDKARYSNVRPHQIPELLEKHFDKQLVSMTH